MNMPTRKLGLAVAALLGSTLLLPASALAHDRGDHDYQRMGPGHHHPQRHHRSTRSNEWYLLQHREARPYGYRSPSHGQRKHHSKHHYGHHHNHGRGGERSESYRHEPVRLQLEYVIVL